MLCLVENNQDERKMSLFRGSKSIVLIGLILLAAGGALAEATGKIVGKVTDKKTGEGLSYSFVTIIGTQISVSADENGNFVIENVPAGTYNLRVRMIGYKDIEKTNVCVYQGQTTVRDFTFLETSSNKHVWIPKKDSPNVPVTGKIAGKVTCDNNSDVLAFANVKLIGTKYSAQVDMAGHYCLNVPLGTYVIRAEMLGFHSSEMIEVQVFKGKTTVRNFDLKAVSKSIY